MGARFYASVQTGSVQLQTGLCAGGKAAGRGVNHASPYSPEVKESVQLNLYSTSGPS